MTSAWLTRTLFVGPYLALVTSQAEYKKALKDLNLTDDDEFVPSGWHACTHTFKTNDGSIACIVGLNMENAAKMEPIDVAALLVHEAVHVWQYTERAAGTNNPFGDEGEAYFVQNISATLMHAYAEKLK